MTNGHTDPHGQDGNSAAKATRQGVAIVGFVLIAIIGMTIAVYAARFVPSALSGMASATAYVSSLFVPPLAEEPENEAPVIEEEPAPEEPEETPVIVTPVAPTTTPAVTPAPAAPKPVTPAYYGLPDLTASITAVGYCTSQNSFVRSSSIPSGARYGVQFTLTNLGTNIASGWRYMVETPDGDVEQPGITLYPSRSAVGITCFTPQNGDDVEVTIDSRGAVTESNEGNNTKSYSLTGRGTSSNDNDDLWCDITASDRSINEGDTITLRWETEDADDARINQGIGSVDEDGGSRRVSPRSDTTYRLTVENDGDEETCSVTVRVDED